MFASTIRRNKKSVVCSFLSNTWKQSTTKKSESASYNTMATKVTEDFANFEATLNKTNPMPDYVKLMEEKMKADVIMPNDVFNACWRKISAAARDSLWHMLFEEKQQPAKKEQLEKIAEFMKLHKEDACFYQASDYNKWVVKVRDELLKRQMLEFWQDQMVTKELGPCWARDSDLFDDPEDPEPANFYKFANCEAPWLKNKKAAIELQALPTETLTESLLTKTDTPKTTKTLKKISMETPLEDYKYNVDTQGDIDGDDEEAYKQIFTEAREMVWQLLFSQTKLSPDNHKKAAALLDEIKRDACFYSPYAYNDWIPTVRDELFKRNYFEFWQIIVEKQLGLCWALDSDYFDDTEDPKPIEFYKSGDELMKQHKK